MGNSSIFSSITQFITQFIPQNSQSNDDIGKNKPIMAEISIPLNNDQDSNDNTDIPTTIDWMSPDCKVTEHFTVSDCCMLHAWNRLANEMDGFTDEMKTKLVILCNKIEEIRTFLGCPINVHSMFRSQEYNKEQNIQPNADVHSFGEAIDMDCSPNLTIDEIKIKLEPVLEKFEIRMEKGTTTWVHLDVHAVGPSGRYFTA